MNKYVDADKLLETIQQHDYRLTIANSSIDNDMLSIDIKQVINEQPTTDVAHGYWINHTYKMDYGDNVRITVCSNCSNDMNFWLTHGYILSDKKYCPNCGAKMD